MRIISLLRAVTYIFIASVFVLQPVPPRLSTQDLRLLFGHDDREYITSQRMLFPWAAIGVLQMHSGATCTATLVAPDTILTAAHCFWMHGKVRDEPRFFWAGKHKNRFVAQYQATQLTVSPVFSRGLYYRGDDVYIRPTVAPFDIATVKVRLLDGVAPKPLPVFRGDKAALSQGLERANWRVTQAGYGGDEGILTAHRQCQVTKLNTNLTLYHQCDTLSGDSGSPLWTFVSNQPQLVAVQSSAPDVENRDVADNIAVSVLRMSTLDSVGLPSPKRVR